MSGTWLAVLATSAGCFALKLAGLALPERILGRPWLSRFVDLVPVALLAGLAAAVVALMLRAPFLVVVVVAAATAAGLRLLGIA